MRLLFNHYLIHHIDHRPNFRIDKIQWVFRVFRIATRTSETAPTAAALRSTRICCNSCQFPRPKGILGNPEWMKVGKRVPSTTVYIHGRSFDSDQLALKWDGRDGMPTRRAPVRSSGSGSSTGSRMSLPCFPRPPGDQPVFSN